MAFLGPLSGIGSSPLWNKTGLNNEIDYYEQISRVSDGVADPDPNPDPDPPDLLYMFLGLMDPDPDPLVNCMDPDPEPFIIKQK